ncbi:hypothetical protein AAFN85_07380 [Mucilaginibacter sp. CAU 1740]|uniref:hypothetical protein n=1 Tax=Mucilaginibacter sp. CAU 1740 TaxID=3140365 RepID=UPI00325BC18A
MKKTKVKLIITLILLLVIVVFGYFRYYFVFGEGTKAGTMNYFVKKGYVFKTYEGRLIQSGIRSQIQGGTIGSNEFMFSVTDEKVAKELSSNAGSFLELHYKEYTHTLPWRGVSVFVVDSIISAKPATPGM